MGMFDFLKKNKDASAAAPAQKEMPKDQPVNASVSATPVQKPASEQGGAKGKNVCEFC